MLSAQPKKSSLSGGNGNCVQVALRDGVVEVTDSKNPDAEPHRYTTAEWDAFVRGVKGGEFDLPQARTP